MPDGRAKAVAEGQLNSMKAIAAPSAGPMLPYEEEGDKSMAPEAHYFMAAQAKPGEAKFVVINSRQINGSCAGSVQASTCLANGKVLCKQTMPR